ncbi:polyprotein [Qipengyuania citrea LAMA 915]|uniref:Polyprotein n=1 Tax=Qipengyuania citrea LAMA 915 TaxID=1306953 RepID=A0A0L1KDD7_9SPHN|nr:relaxase/mobilization nuclease domain-containing protein [Qipengyuania citrea]KNH01899.1 polyprotein [Qipengyuania citrea LAMA 915]
MIIKKIRRKTPARATTGSEFAYVARLTRYMVRADLADLRKLALHEEDAHVHDLVTYIDKEEVIAAGAINLLGKTLEHQQLEMQALLHRCKNGAGALDHWVISWSEDNEPTVDEVENSISIFLRCQGLKNCPVVWAVHNDTDNLHAHLAVLRIDCMTAERVEAGRGWDIDCAMRAKAVIECEFPHWQREEGSIYEVRAGKLVRTRDNVEIGPADQPHLWARLRKEAKQEGKVLEADGSVDVTQRLDQRSRNYEQQTGYKSRERVALEIAVPIAVKSTNWDECHRRLAMEGISIERTRYGANFVIGGKPVKASIDRSTSFAKLKARFGEKEFKPSRYTVGSAAPRELWPEGSKRHDYFVAKRSHDARLKAALARFRDGRRGRAGGAFASDVLTGVQASASFPSFDEWTAGSQPPDPAEVVAGVLEFGVIEVAAPSDASQQPQAHSIAGFTPIKLRDRVIYRRASDPPGRPSFIDLGDRVLVNAAKDRDAVRVALLLVVKNNPYAEIAVFGDRSFKKLALEIANEESVALHGALGRRQMQRQRVGDTKPGQGDREGSLKSATINPPSPSGSHRQPKRKGPASPSQPDSPVPPQSAASPHDAFGRDKMLALISRMFHSSDWDPSEFWSESMLGRLNSGIASAMRTFDEIRRGDRSPQSEAGTSRPDVADAQAQAAEAARRAAAIASASRGF